MKAVTNPLHFFLLLHNKCECVLQFLQLPSLLSYLALEETHISRRDMFNSRTSDVIENGIIEILSDLSA